MASSSSLRDRVRLAAEREATAARTGAHDQSFLDGAIAAYDWLLGAAPAPISGRTGAYSINDIMEEENLADDAIYRRADSARVAQTWAVGVQHALMWARGKADISPGGPFGDPPLQQ